MTDIFTKKKRSRVMSKVARADTPYEILVRKFLFSKGFRFRKNYKALPGSPDIALPKYKFVIFIHGCFWHLHTCSAGRIPASNKAFWTEKLTNNKKRDQEKNKQLKKMGWRVIEIWECDLKTENQRMKTLNKLLKKIV
ncbi:MAG TPA: DNA mismatch endonuclease Vsr [Chitinophagaceae bacterium]|nr:DNA mismatch endonuclease Vsr [Chitinophagaceae bacterium]